MVFFYLGAPSIRSCTWWGERVAVLLGRGSAKATGLSTAGVRRWLAVYSVMPPIAVLVCGGLGMSRVTAPASLPHLLHRTPSLYRGWLLSKSLFPSFFLGAGGLPEASTLCAHVLGVQQGLRGLPIPFLDPTNLSSESHNSSSKLYRMNCEIYVFFKLTH